MEVFKPIKEFVKNGLPVLDDDKVISQKNGRKKQSYHNRISIDVFTQDLEDSITDLEKRIEKLEEGFREIELKNRDI